MRHLKEYEELTDFTKDVFNLTTSITICFDNEEAIMFKDSAKKIRIYLEKVLKENGISFEFKELFLSKPIGKYIYLDYKIDGKFDSISLRDLFPSNPGEIFNFPLRLTTDGDKFGGFEFLYWNDSVGIFNKEPIS